MCNGNCNQGRNCNCSQGPRITLRRMFGVPAWLIVTVIAAIFLTACAGPKPTVDPVKFFAESHKLDPAPADWPDLVIEVDYVPDATARIICAPVIAGQFIAGCAFMNFARGACMVTINHSMRSEWIVATLAEELKHCRGQDHVGESTMRDAWARYKSMTVASHE